MRKAVIKLAKRQVSHLVDRQPVGRERGGHCVVGQVEQVLQGRLTGGGRAVDGR